MPSKTSSTLYTPERLTAARRNIEDFGWAQALRDEAVAAAEPFVARDDDWLWYLVTGQRLPRSHHVNRPLGSPTGGTDIYQGGIYPWLYDVMDQPWKIVDPVTGHVFPTNDFGAYHRSGLDERGVFDPDRADRSLLVNELYPEEGPTWGVDDGFGWIDQDGDKWLFVAYYNHWALWLSALTNDGAVHGAIRSLSEAFVYTGDLGYAHAGLILLDRVADVYPSLDIRAYAESKGYLNSHGGTGKGRAIGSIWEAAFLVPDLVRAYDAFFPAIADVDDADVVPYLSAKAEEYDLPAKDSVDAIKVNIENNLLREIFPAVQDAQIRGNFGMHQNVLATAAVVLDSEAESPEWIDWVFATGGLVQEPDWHLTGGNVFTTLVDDVDRDGFGHEAATGYNYGWLTALAALADALEGYPGYPAADLYRHPKYAKMIQARASLTMLNRYLPSIADGGLTGNPALHGTAQDYTRYFEQYGDPLFAQYAYLLNGDRVDGLYGSMFSTDVSGTQQRIDEAIGEHGSLQLPSENLTGYGLAALRAGADEQMRDAWVYYGRSWGPGAFSHPHRDTLNLGMHAFGVDLLPDIGYPENVGTNPLRFEWTANTVAHNCVVVDARPQEHQWVAEPKGFATSERVQYADVAAPTVYPETSVYRRAVAMVAIDDESSYAVDVFRIVGGNDHVFSFHAADGAVTTDGLTLVEQPTGTYAGPDGEVPSPGGDFDPDSPGFDWLFNVERDTDPAGTFSVDWAVRDTWNVGADPDLHVRLTMLSEIDDVALADGFVPVNRPIDPPHLRYLLAHRGEPTRHMEDDDPAVTRPELASQFVSVIEPYIGQQSIQSTQLVPVKPRDGRIEPHEVAAVRIELSHGRVDYVVQSLRSDVLLDVNGEFLFRGSFGVYSLQNGRPAYAFHHDATILTPAPHMQAPRPAVTGQLADFTRELSDANELVITLDHDVPDPEDLVGGYVYVENDGVRNAVYQIHAAKLHGTTLVLDIGDTTTIRGYVDNDDFDAGYRYDIEPGAPVHIPLTREWQR